MTALEKYQRLEAGALWRESAEAQRRDVVLSIGDATVTISDLQDRPLTHWSIAALTRANPGEFPAIYHPDGDPQETLEIAEDETEMLDALEKLRMAVLRRRPQRGRLRLGLIGGFAAATLALGLFWLPGALKTHALTVLPDVKREEIGRQLFAEVQALTGRPCTGTGGTEALALLSKRVTPAGVTPPRIYVMPSGMQDSLSLPGPLILLSRDVVEDHEDPEIVAGYVVAEALRAQDLAPMRHLLDSAGITGVLRLLTTGDLSDAELRAYARELVSTRIDPLKELPAATLLEGFRAAGIQARPYAMARDASGESVLPLVEGDPYPSGAPEPVLRDSDWLRLQSICIG